jgi:hypothetical protein
MIFPRYVSRIARKSNGSYTENFILSSVMTTLKRQVTSMAKNPTPPFVVREDATAETSALVCITSSSISVVVDVVSHWRKNAIQSCRGRGRSVVREMRRRAARSRRTSSIVRVANSTTGLPCARTVRVVSFVRNFHPFVRMRDRAIVCEQSWRNGDSAPKHAKVRSLWLTSTIPTKSTRDSTSDIRELVVDDPLQIAPTSNASGSSGTVPICTHFFFFSLLRFVAVRSPKCR